MPRKPRKVPPEGYLHITSRGNNRKRIFSSKQNKKIYYIYLQKLKKEENINICHYCIMDNHVHLLVKVKEKSNLSKFIKRINLKYTSYYRSKYDYCGHLWQGRFHSTIIDNESYLLQCGKYIELNPIRARIVSSPEKYQFSSYSYYGFGQTDPLITPNPLYEDLSEKYKKRQQLYKNWILEKEI
ncbi:MAG: transposase [Candidatus Omnitrophica bacterium]|nr:transposase [Candidatus Omnitrophota bacterium]